eukprot:TRINITY_DN9772_c0_g1_i1.p1 TRINITY_DN9772_c0_g1~~TRINITY_DN9772_c0_g1_i1.p1  ORF type:complete len:54 (+),score=21.82 TRINITY_DN9772_c0_g1_i1:282-443(+)
MLPNRDIVSDFVLGRVLYLSVIFIKCYYLFPINKKKKYRLRGRSSETAKAHRG